MSSSGVSGDLESRNEIEAIKLLSEKVEELYKFRDRYFENHSLEEAINRNKDTENELDSVIKVFGKYEESALQQDAARYYYFRGRALNVKPDYNKDAEDLLSKAIKLDPKLVDAWNELGECYWKNNKLKEATNCFTGALKHYKNKVSLRNLSMLARQENTSNREEKMKNIEKGLNYAKDAVNLDPQDGLSWCVLGNAHLSYFFGIQQNPKTLKQCLVAYTQAEQDVIAKSTPDLHYNKGITLKYEEEFELALDSFNKASMYDPTWEPPQVKEKQLVKYLNDISELVSTSGKMKPKRLQQMIKSIEFKQLGPYEDRITDTPPVLSDKTSFKFKSGINEKRVVLGKVVCTVHNEDTVPFTFCLVDNLGNCAVVTVYNLADGKGVIIGDSVAIPDPNVRFVDFKYKEKHYQFRLIRVQTPLILVVNGKKVNRDFEAGVQMSIFKKCD